MLRSFHRSDECALWTLYSPPPGAHKSMYSQTMFLKLNTYFTNDLDIFLQNTFNLYFKIYFNKLC
jgi:hypothetical protein